MNDLPDTGDFLTLEPDEHENSRRNREDRGQKSLGEKAQERRRVEDVIEHIEREVGDRTHDDCSPESFKESPCDAPGEAGKFPLERHPEDNCI